MTMILGAFYVMDGGLKEEGRKGKGDETKRGRRWKSLLSEEKI